MSTLIQKKIPEDSTSRLMLLKPDLPGAVGVQDFENGLHVIPLNVHKGHEGLKIDVRIEATLHS